MLELRLVRKWACPTCYYPVVVATNKEGKRVLRCGCGEVAFTANRETLADFKLEKIDVPEGAK